MCSSRTRFVSTLVLVVVVAVVALLSSPASAQTLAETLDDLRSIKLGTTRVAVSEQPIEIGHLRVLFKTGALHPLVTDGGQVLGVYFEGTGVYHYRSEDPADRQITAANFAAISKARIYNDHTLRDEFSRALVWFARPAFEELWDPQHGVAVEQPADPAAQKGFEAIWQRVGATYLEHEHLAADVRLNGGDGQYVYMEIDGKIETFGYCWDTLRDDEERAFLFRKFGDYDLRFRQSFSTQPIGPRTAEPPGPVQLIHADLDLSTEDNRSATIVAALDYEVLEDDLAVVALGLINNVDPYQYDWESARDSLRVTSITDAQGRPLEYSHRYHQILIRLAEPAAAGDTIRLHVESAGEVLTDANGLHADNYWELVFSNWFPVPLGWIDGNALFTMNLRCRTRKPFRPVASGTVVSFEEDGDSYVLETSSETPLKIVALLAARYEVVEEVFDDLTIRVYAYSRGRKNVMKNMPTLAHAIVRYYEGLVGPYPFDELNIVEVPDYGYGIGPAGVVMMTTEAYRPHQDSLAAFLSRGINARLAHEIAHQWFGHRVMAARPRDNWISESFAEYLSGMAMAAAGQQARVMGFDQMLDEWWGDTLMARNAGPISAAGQLIGDDAFAERFYLLYSRGPLVLRMLHSMVGTEGFTAILRRFLDNADGGYAMTADFGRAASEVLGMDVSWFVEDWIERGGVPQVDVKWSAEPAEGGGFVLVGTVAVAAGNDHKRFVVPLVVEYRDGPPQVVPIDLDAPSKEFRVPLRAKPRKVIVDPARNCLAKFG